CRSALRFAQQLRRSAHAALHSVGRFRHHGGDGRHAHVLGSAAWCRHLRRAPGLHIERHGQLDVVHRHPHRSHRSVLSARRSRPAAAAENGMSVLAVTNLTKRFGSLVAVRDISLTVDAGELRAVIGPNGAGKTTFFNLVSGFLAPSTGSILFDGRDITSMPAHQRVGLGMARTFQITEIFPELTVFENIRIVTEVAAGYRLRPWLSRAEAADVRRRIEEALALAALSDMADRLVGELAHGDQRATEIMMALALQPRLL